MFLLSLHALDSFAVPGWVDHPRPLSPALFSISLLSLSPVAFNVMDQHIHITGLRSHARLTKHLERDKLLTVS